MKLVTNILLTASIICYIFLPFYELSFEGAWTGLKYTSETISHIEELQEKLFVLIPFAACFGGILFNCLKSRLWGFATCACIAGGLYFYHLAQDISVAANPHLFSISGIGYGFNIGYMILIAALASTVVSLLPLSFNKQK
ncbi:MAG: hypothetical protein IJ328_05270 [Muribaculaceae bacterium]|nr:hypothetical protein [Muribaculaceae bacterium]